MQEELAKNGIYNAKVNDIYNQDSGVYVTQGVKKCNQGKFERSIQGKGKGSNGSYLMFDEKVTYTFLQLYVYDLNKTICIDIRTFLKEKYNGRRLTKAFLEKVLSNMPKKIKVKCINNTWKIVDYDRLQINNLI